MKFRASATSIGNGEAIVYDEDAHREFITGFRKRKQARRLEAKANAEKLAKETRRQLREEKRNYIREQREQFLSAATLSDDNGDDSDLDASRDPDAVVHRFENADGAVVTAVVAPLDAPFPAPTVNDLQENNNQDVEENASDSSLKDNVEMESTKQDDCDCVSHVTDRQKGRGKYLPVPVTMRNSASNKALKATLPVQKSKWHRRHISYTHAHHKRRSKNKANNTGRTTHSERRKRQGR